MTRYKVRVIGYREGQAFKVEAKDIREASRKAREKLGLDFHQYLVEEDPKSP